MASNVPFKKSCLDAGLHLYELVQYSLIDMKVQRRFRLHQNEFMGKFRPSSSLLWTLVPFFAIQVVLAFSMWYFSQTDRLPSQDSR